MARYDVFEHGPDEILVVDVQADLLDHLKTRVVVPLLTISNAPIPAKFLNPVVQIEGEKYVFIVQFLSAIPATELEQKVTNIEAHSDDITRALDMVFQGF